MCSLILPNSHAGGLSALAHRHRFFLGARQKKVRLTTGQGETGPRFFIRSKNPMKQVLAHVSGIINPNSTVWTSLRNG